jgi:DNA-binding LytR/AlgR family response regulator
MKCLIVDDNKLARMSLNQMAVQSKILEVAGECASAIEAFEFLRTNLVDILFLDVEMPEMSGIELVKSLTQKPVVILTTSNKDYAAEAFDLSLADFLVKPFTFPRFMQAVQKASDLLQRSDSEISNIGSDYLFIKENKAVKKLAINSILWMEAMGDYVKINTDKKTYIVHTSLRVLEEKMNPALFIRVHRSYIISIDKIEWIEDGVINIAGKSIPLADTYKTLLNRRLNPI